MAEVDQQLSQERQSLQAELDNLRSRQLERAQNLRQTELDRDQQRRQFQQEQEELRRQHQREMELARQQAASSGGAGSTSPTPSFNIPGGNQQSNQTNQQFPQANEVHRDETGRVISFNTDTGTHLTDYGVRKEKELRRQREQERQQDQSGFNTIESGANTFMDFIGGMF